MRLAAGLRPDPLGELERSPRPLGAIGGGVLLLRGMEGRRGELRRKGREKGGGGRKKGGQGNGRELPPLYLTSSYERGRIQNRLQFANERAVDDRCRHSERIQMCRQIVPDSWCVVLLGWTLGGAMCYVLVRERVPLRVGG